MSISFSALVIYLLPGFLGLWVFKNIVQEDIDRRSESTQIAIALLLGISSIACLCALNFVLSCLPCIAEYISPKALQTTGDEAPILLAGDIKFWTSYITLCLLALLSGGLSAWARERGLGLTWIFSDIANKCLHRWINRPCESGMRALIDEMREKGHEPSLLKVYSLIGNRDTALLGWWDGCSDKEKELKMTLLECCDAASDLSKEFDLQTRRCLVNYDSGIVIEFLDIDEHQAEGFEEYIKEMYRKTVHPRSE
mgnify:CR=1 FL=1